MLLQGPFRDKKYVINMDQTAVYFSMTLGTTLDKHGAKSINVCLSSSSTMRLTACLGDRRKLKREKNSKEEGDQSSPTPVVSP